MTRFNPLLLLGVLATLGLTSPAHGGDQVPFKGYFLPRITEAIPVPGSTTLLYLEADLTVKATHLGKAQGPAWFILDTSDPSRMPYYGESTWFAANGDSVHQTFEGEFRATETPGLYDNVESFTIDGGTGRFAARRGGRGRWAVRRPSGGYPSPSPVRGDHLPPGSLNG